MSIVSRSLFIIGLSISVTGIGATAEPLLDPIATRVIYPGETIGADAVSSMFKRGEESGRPENPIESSQIVGRRARRTLLPGARIFVTDVDDQIAVKNGSQVRLIYQIGNMTIETVGQALQNGAAAETIRVRNSDTGVVVIGRIRPDGLIYTGE